MKSYAVSPQSLSCILLSIIISWTRSCISHSVRVLEWPQGGGWGCRGIKRGDIEGVDEEEEGKVGEEKGGKGGRGGRGG